MLLASRDDLLQRLLFQIHIATPVIELVASEGQGKSYLLEQLLGRVPSCDVLWLKASTGDSLNDVLSLHEQVGDLPLLPSGGGFSELAKQLLALNRDVLIIIDEFSATHAIYSQLIDLQLWLLNQDRIRVVVASKQAELTRSTKLYLVGTTADELKQLVMTYHPDLSSQEWQLVTTLDLDSPKRYLLAVDAMLVNPPQPEQQTMPSSLKLMLLIALVLALLMLTLLAWHQLVKPIRPPLPTAETVSSSEPFTSVKPLPVEASANDDLLQTQTSQSRVQQQIDDTRSPEPASVSVSNAVSEPNAVEQQADEAEQPLEVLAEGQGASEVAVAEAIGSEFIEPVAGEQSNVNTQVVENIEVTTVPAAESYAISESDAISASYAQMSEQLTDAVDKPLSDTSTPASGQIALSPATLSLSQATELWANLPESAVVLQFAKLSSLPTAQQFVERWRLQQKAQILAVSEQQVFVISTPFNSSVELAEFKLSLSKEQMQLGPLTKKVSVLLRAK